MNVTAAKNTLNCPSATEMNKLCVIFNQTLRQNKNQQILIFFYKNELWTKNQQMYILKMCALYLLFQSYKVTAC